MEILSMVDPPIDWLYRPQDSSLLALPVCNMNWSPRGIVITYPLLHVWTYPIWSISIGYFASDSFLSDTTSSLSIWSETDMTDSYFYLHECMIILLPCIANHRARTCHLRCKFLETQILFHSVLCPDVTVSILINELDDWPNSLIWWTTMAFYSLPHRSKSNIHYYPL